MVVTKNMLQEHNTTLLGASAGNWGNPAVLHEVFDTTLRQLREKPSQDSLDDGVDEVLVAVLVRQEIQ